MLQKADPIDVLIELPDSELKTAVKKGDFPPWVVDYVEYVIAWDGNKEGDYFTTWEGDYGSRAPSYPSNRRSGGKGSSRQTYH